MKFWDQTDVQIKINSAELAPLFLSISSFPKTSQFTQIKNN